jgi:hypothetical protein
MQSIISSLNRRGLLAVAATAALLVSLGCSSTPPGGIVERFTYPEKINSVLFSPKFSKLIVLGERYHYLFDDKKGVDKVISASFAKDLVGSFGTFVVDPSNRITGSYKIQTRSMLTPIQKDEAKRLGFNVAPNGQAELTENIAGERFTTAPLPINVEQSQLNRTYVVDVKVYGYNYGVKAPPSPVAQFADSVAGLFLFPVFTVTMFVLW